MNEQIKNIQIAHGENTFMGTDHENARRIAACLNACDGVSTEDIEAVSVNTGPLLANKLAEADTLRAYAGKLQRQRDELLEALKWALTGLGKFDRERNRSNWEQHQKALAAIAKAEGGAA